MALTSKKKAQNGQIVPFLAAKWSMLDTFYDFRGTLNGALKWSQKGHHVGRVGKFFNLDQIGYMGKTICTCPIGTE